MPCPKATEARLLVAGVDDGRGGMFEAFAEAAFEVPDTALGCAKPFMEPKVVVCGGLDVAGGNGPAPEFGLGPGHCPIPLALLAPKPPIFTPNGLIPVVGGSIMLCLKGFDPVGCGCKNPVGLGCKKLENVG